MTCYKIAFYYSKALKSHPYASTQEKGTDDYDEMTYSSEIGRSWQASKLIIKKFLKETLSLSLSIYWLHNNKGKDIADHDEL